MNPVKNHRTTTQILILSALLALIPPAASAVTISGLTANTNTVGQYERYELTFNLNGLPSNFNPFRPEPTGDSLSGPGVDVRAEVVTPSGQTKVVWGFFDVDYTFLGPGSNPEYRDKDRIVPTKNPHWHIRYAPEQLGTYRVTVRATDQSGTATSSQMTFTCVPSGSKGFVRVSKDGTRFTYSDGSPFVPFGIQTPYGAKATHKAMAEMKANGMNFVRRWLVDRDSDDIFREFEGWGKYSTDSSTRRTGSRSVVMNVKAPGFVEEQTYIGCKPNTYYKAYIYFKTSSNFNGKAGLEITEERGDRSSKVWSGAQVGAGANWVRSEVTFRTASNAEFLHFRPKVYSGSTGAVWVDDCAIYEVDAGGNTVIDWNMVFNPSFELWTPAQLRMVALGRFEYMLQLGEEYGIVIQPCIFNYRLWNATDPVGLYAKFYGDFFTDSSSIAQQRRVLRYLVARFSSYRSVFAWELTNEMDASYTDIRGNWIKGHANFLHQNDPQSHIVTNSLWSSPGDIQYAQMPELDINQVHYYINTEERVGGQGVPGWWQQNSGVTIDGSSSNAYSGSKSLKFGANGSTLTESQTIYCQPSRSYTLRYRLKLSGINGSASAIVRVFDGKKSQISTAVNQSDSGSFGYTTREKTFSVPSSAAYLSLEFRVTGSSGTAWIDNVEVICNTTGQNLCYNGGFESPNFGDDEYEWGLYNTIRSVTLYEAGPAGSPKPWASGEWGLMGANADLSYWARPNDNTKPRKDSTGIHVHNCIWAQLMASSAVNTPSYWWIDEYLAPYNLWHRWKGATAFAARLPFYERGQRIATAPYPADVQAKSSDARIRVLGQKSGNNAYMWIQNSGYTWSRVVRDGVNPTAVSATITIPGFTNGTTCKVEWYDTTTGAVTKTESKTASGGAITLSVSSLSKDVAVIISSGSGTTPPPPVGNPNVGLQIKADKSTALPNETITYTVIYTNTGDDAATNVNIRLPIPANTTYVEGSAGSGAYDAGSNSVRWTVPSLAPGATGQFTAKVKVN